MVIENYLKNVRRTFISVEIKSTNQDNPVRGCIPNVADTHICNAYGVENNDLWQYLPIFIPYGDIFNFIFLGALTKRTQMDSKKLV